MQNRLIMFNSSICKNNSIFKTTDTFDVHSYNVLFAYSRRIIRYFTENYSLLAKYHSQRKIRYMKRNPKILYVQRPLVRKRRISIFFSSEDWFVHKMAVFTSSGLSFWFLTRNVRNRVLQ